MILSIYFFIRVASVEDFPTPFFAKFRKKEKSGCNAWRCNRLGKMVKCRIYVLDAEYYALNVVGNDAEEVAYEGNPGDVLHVPAEGDFSSPITTTPAAEPIMSIEPPTPAQ